MAAINTPREYIDISNFWPNGQTVNAIASELHKTDLELNRYTLTKARAGQLEKCEVSTLRRLLRLCSQWAGRPVVMDEICTKGATP
jgi:hypothetical protein